MNEASAFYLDGHSDGRLHLQHGPIDLIIGVDDAGEKASEHRRLAYEAAYVRFVTVLDELVSELPLLKQPVRASTKLPDGAVAQRMVSAVMPFAAHHFITPMAAVAGSVADEILAAILTAFPAEARPQKIYVNNGGDIALHLEAHQTFRIRIAREDGADYGDLVVRHQDASRGIATSGRTGRSLSFGIADSVTATAADAATADAATTLIANAVDLPGHTAIKRSRATDVSDDSDLGERLVVTGCGLLSGSEVNQALDAGLSVADDFMAQGLIHRAGLFLQSEGRLAGLTPSNHHSFQTPILPVEQRHHA